MLKLHEKGYFESDFRHTFSSRFPKSETTGLLGFVHYKGMLFLALGLHSLIVLNFAIFNNIFVMAYGMHFLLFMSPDEKDYCFFLYF